MIVQLYRISDKEFEDKDFPGFPFIIDFLSKLVDWNKALH